MFVLLALFVSFTSSAFARPSTASANNLGIANDYNAFVFDKGNFKEGWSEVQGRLAIGGDANIRNYSVARLVPLTDVAVPYNTVIGGGGNAQTWSGTLYGSVVSNGNTTTIRTPDVRGSVFALRALDLGGSSGSGGTVQGDAVYGTTFRKDSNVTVQGQIRQASTALPFSFSAAQTDLLALSSRLKNLSATGTTTVFS